MPTRDGLPELKDCVRSETEIRVRVEALSNNHHQQQDDGGNVDEQIREGAIAAFAAPPRNNRNVLAVASDHTGQQRCLSAVIRAMKTHQEDSIVQEQACGVLWTLGAIQSSKSSRETISNLGGIEAVINAMKKHMPIAAVQKEALHTLRLLAAHSPRNQGLIAGLFGIPLILEVMRVHSNEPGVQEYACGALWNLSLRNGANEDAIVASGGVGQVARAMAAFPHNSQVQLNACGLFFSLAWSNDKNARFIVDEGGVEAAVKAIQMHPYAEALHEQAAAALIHLAKDQYQLVADNGGIEALLNAYLFDRSAHHARAVHNITGALRTLVTDNSTNINPYDGLTHCILAIIERNPSSVHVQQAAYAVLSAIAETDQSDLPLVADRLLSPMIGAMQKHPNCGELLGHILSLLAALSVSSECESVRIILVQLGGIAAIIGSMNKHVGDLDLQTNACRVLKSLVAGNEQMVFAAGGVESILSAMRSHPSAATIQRDACHTLQVLSLNRLLMKKFYVESMETAVLHCMEMLGDEAGVQEGACMVLRNLLDLGVSATFECSEGIRAILSTMKAHREEVRVQEAACGVLLSIGDNMNITDNHSSTCTWIGEVVPELLLCMGMHPNAVNLQAHACGALGSFGAKADESIRKMVDLDTISTVVVDSMKLHCGIAKIQENACRALANWVSTDESKQFFVESLNGIDAIVAAMEGHPGAAAVQARACRALFVFFRMCM